MSPSAYGRPGGWAGRRRTAALAVLAVVVLAMEAACSSSPSPTAAASSPEPAASISVPHATGAPAGSSAPGGTSAPAGAPSAPAGGVTASPASASIVIQLENVADIRHYCGYTSSADVLKPVNVTNNGWAMGRITALNPRDQGNCDIVFKQNNGSWAEFADGSDFTGQGIPQDVLTALYNAFLG